jgi:hypothetical protein
VAPNAWVVAPLHREKPPMSTASQTPSPKGLIQLTPGRQKPWLAFLVSFLLPGGGQLYNRQFLKGALFLGALAAITGTWYFGQVVAHPGVFTIQNRAHKSIILSIFVFSIDAYLVAVRLRCGDAVHPWQWF